MVDCTIKTKVQKKRVNILDITKQP